MVQAAKGSGSLEHQQHMKSLQRPNQSTHILSWSVPDGQTVLLLCEKEESNISMIKCFDIANEEAAAKPQTTGDASDSFLCPYLWAE